MAAARGPRAALVAAYRDLIARGLSQGTSGNVSVRHGTSMLITPSAVPPATMRAADIANVDIAGDGVWRGPRKPSSEWRIHRDIYRARPEVVAVVHTHSPYATALAMARRAIPAAHYMVAAFGGADVRCSGYATFGTAELSAAAVAALAGRSACLLANHGAIALGASLDDALLRASELETLTKQYLLSLAAGPVLLSAQETAEALTAFGAYRAGGFNATPEMAAPTRRRRPSGARGRRAPTFDAKS